MKKICLFLAVLMLFSTLASCSSGLPSVPSETGSDVSATKDTAEQKVTREETEEEPIMQQGNPADDGVINVLMIGASFTYYYVEELHSIAKAAGIKMKVCNAYYSGCNLEKHWTWWKLGENHYEYFETDESGRKKVLANAGLRTCLLQENWDAISLGQVILSTRDDLELAKEKYYRYIADLQEFIKSQFPQTELYWHQAWAYQIGYDRNGFAVKDSEQQAEMAGWGKNFALAVCKDYPFTRLPSGDAWQYARQDARVGDVLCNRGSKTDNYHDGDVGGGQYLNACVWFETITGQSCIGNTWRPETYSLSEDKIAALQQAAHRAVEESRGVS